MIQAGRSWEGDDFLCPLKIVAGVFIYFFHALLDIELKQPLQLQTQTPLPCWGCMALDVGTVTLPFYLILDFLFTSFIPPVGNKCSEAFLDIALKNNQLMLIVTGTHSSPLISVQAQPCTYH